jgi:hypothetical protein
MQTRPDITLIIEAVAQHLLHDVLPDMPPGKAYHVRVAANALRLIQRELRLMPIAIAAERERLSELLGESGSISSSDNDLLNRRLAGRIANGEVGFDTPLLIDHLWKTTLAQLAIDQPNYGAYLRSDRAKEISEDS